MADCVCGARVESAARFCGSCGEPVGEQSALFGVATTAPEVAAVRGVDRRLLGIAGLLLAVIVGWSALSSSPPEAQPADESASQAERPTTTAPSPTTSSPNDEPTTTEGDASGETTVLRDEVTIEQIGDGSPLLGEVTGLHLVIGFNFQRPSVLDLDTGELLNSPHQSGPFTPTVVVGDWIVGTANDELAALPLDDLGGELVSIGTGFGPRTAQPPRSDNRVWVTSYGEESEWFSLIDVPSGNEIERAGELEYGVGNQRWPVLAPSSTGLPALFGHNAGGVYEAAADGDRRVAFGHLWAADDTRVLIESCDATFDCGFEWFDRSTWEKVDLRVPEVGSYEIWFVPGTDWLFTPYFSPENQGARLLNVVTGSTYDFDDRYTDSIYSGTVAISPDGRWLALPYGVELTIVDLLTGEERLIEGLDRVSPYLLLTEAPVGYSSP